MRTTLLLALTAVLLALVTLTSILVGARMISPGELLSVARGAGSDEVTSLVVAYRVPRTLVALVVGADARASLAKITAAFDAYRGA